MRFTVYQIDCNTSNHVYVGQTCNYTVRIFQHRGQGRYQAVFVKKHGVRTARRICIVESRLEAIRVEALWHHALERRGFVVGGDDGTPRQVSRGLKRLYGPELSTLLDAAFGED